MQDWKNISVHRRIILGFGIVTLLTLAIGFTAFTMIRDGIHQAAEFTDRDVPLLTVSHELNILALQHRRYEKDFLLNIGKPKKQTGYLEKFDKVSQKMIARMDALAILLKDVDPSGVQNEGLAKAKQAYLTYRDSFLALAKEISQTPEIAPQEGNQRMKPFKDHIYTFESFIREVVEFSMAFSQASADTAREQGNRSLFKISGAALFSVLVSLVFAVLISVNIKRVLTTAVTDLSAVAGEVSSASGQVAGASQEFATGAATQAASIEETSSSLEEMAAIVRKNEEHVASANGLLSDTGAKVSEIEAALNTLTASMDDIAEAGDKTAGIIRTIDEIAFQTNLLALNAAVEAARAGEAGAGFAVVADEVRNLATRAAEAARDTGRLIQGITEHVQGGAALVSDTNTAFGGIVESHDDLSGLMDEIESASKEQTTGIDQVSQAVSDMGHILQQQASGSEESASAAHEMDAQAGRMMDNIRTLSRFVGISGDTRPQQTLSREPAELEYQEETGSRRLLPGKE
ncbi:MAG: methyl-accepting chemotaxis protein [Desulfobacter sp.]